MRVDTGVQQGDEVSVHYDPMIAKLIVWDRERTGALRRLRNALNAYRIVGVNTNLEFLTTLCTLPALAEGRLNTGFIETHQSSLFPARGALPDEVLALAALYELLIEARQAKDCGRSRAIRIPWGVSNGWRLNQDNFTAFFPTGGDEIEVTAHYRREGYQLELPAASGGFPARLQHDGDLLADIEGGA